MALKLPTNNRNDTFVENNSHTSLDQSVKSPKGDNSSFLKAVRGGDYDVVVEFLDSGKVDVHACNNNGLNALHLASKDGYVDIVTEVLRRNCQVDSKSKKGNTALHVASLAGQLEVVRILIENGADVNIQSQAGFTPLYMAAQENHGEVVRYLLERGANPVISTKDNYTPMAVAVQQNNQEVVEILTEHEQRGKTKLSPLHLAAKKNDVHATIMLLQSEQDPKLRSIMVNDTTKSGFTPLHIASHYGNLNVARVLIQHGSNVNAKAKSSIYPLHVSSKWGRTSVVDLLLKSDADVDCRTKDALTPLHCCSRSGFHDVAELLIEAKADIAARTKHGLTPLHMASQGDHSNTARLLIAKNVPVDAVTVDYLTPLHVAAHCGSYACAKLLLENQCQPNSRALNGFTPLHIACKKNRIRVIELLVKYGSSVESTTETGLTPLHVASFMGYLEVVRFLLNEGSDPEARTDKGETCLHLATRGNQLEVMRHLLEKGANVDAQAKENQTPLHSATKTGSVDAVLLLLQHKASVNAVTKENYTPLHAAAKEGHHEIVEILLDKGADQSVKTLKSFTPLHMSSKYGNVKVGEVLISGGGDVNVESKNGLTPLHLTAHYNQPEMLNLLLQKKSNPQAVAKNGYTPLHIAAKYNELDIACSLLKHKAKPNAESKNGFTPLHLASQEGHVEVVAMLLENKAKVNHQSKNGLTALHLAAQEDEIPVAEILVKHQAEIDSQTKAGYTPLHTACHFGKLNMIEFLLRKGSNVGAITKAGHTPLHQAAQQGHVLVTQMLLKNKANPNTETSDGQTPLWIAERLGYLSVVEVLKGVTSTQGQNQTGSRYKLVEPETMHDVPLSDEDEEERGDDGLNEQSYLYLMGGDLRGLGDDSGPIKDEFNSATMGRTSFSPSEGLSVHESVNWIKGKDEVEAIPFEGHPGSSTTKPRTQILTKVNAPFQETHFDSDPIKPIASDVAREDQNSKKLDVEKLSRDQMNYESRQPDLKVNGFQSSKGDSRTSALQGSKKNEISPHVSRPTDNVEQRTLSSQREVLGVEVDNVFHPGTTSQLKVNDNKLKYDKELVPSSSPAITHGIPYFKSNISETDSHVFGSTYSGMSYASSLDPDNVVMSRQPIFQGFLVSFMVDARGGAMRGCRHSGVRIIIPPGRASQPTRVTCKLVKKEKVPQLPPMMEGEALASRVLVIGPSGAKFLGPVILEVPHFASLRENEREIVVWRSDNGHTWREHLELGTHDVVMKAISGSFDDLENAEDLYHRRITRIISNDFPKYFALVTRIRQEITTLGPQGGVIISSIFPQVQAAFPAGALTKPIKLCLQTQRLPDEFVKQMVGSRVSVSPIATVEPRRRKFHRPITITLPLDPELVANNKGIDKSPSLRLLCSMNDGFDPTEWEDITGTTPMVLNNNCVSFPIAVSARYWLINTPRYKEAVMIATPMFTEASAVPFVANFVVFAKRRDPLDGQLRIFCMTDDKMDKTLESQEKFIEVARSRDIEVLDERPQWIECHGNLIPVLKSDFSDKQPYINFRAFKENRLSLNVRVRDLSQDASANLLFMSEARDVKDQTPLCNLSVTLPSMEEQQRVDVVKDVVELQRKLDELRRMDLSDEDQISKTELRLTDIAEYLEQDWIPLASHLQIDDKDIERIQSEYGYVPEQGLVMLHLWMEKNKDVASGNLLERALSEIGREDIIQKCIFFLQDVTDENEIEEAKNVIYSSGDQQQRSENVNVSHYGGSLTTADTTGHEELRHPQTEHETDVVGYEGMMDHHVDISAQMDSDEAVISTSTGVESLPALLVGTDQFLPRDDTLEIKLKAPRAFEDWVESQEMTYDGNGRNELFHEGVVTQTGNGEDEPPNYYCNFSSLNHLLRPGEKEIEVKVEMEDDDQVLDDGTVIKRQVITRSHFAISHKQEETDLSERLVKVEIEEDVMELSPGISDLGDLDPELVSSDTHISKEAGYFSDCSHGERIPFERKITKTIITYLGQKDKTTNNPSPIRLPKSFCIDSPKYTISSMLSDSISVPNDLSLEASQIVNQALNAALEQIRTESWHLDDYENEDFEDSVAVHVYTDTVENEPEIETSVKEFEETLEDGTIVKRRIIKTKQKQTIIKRVVMEGPEDELPTNEEQAQEMLKQVEDEEPEMLNSPTFGADAQTTKTDVQEYEDVQEDGTVVKRRIVTTTEQQLTTDRVVLEGDISIDEEEANQVFSDNFPETMRL